MPKSASFILLAVLGVILSSSALPTVLDDAMIQLGSGDYVLRKVRYATHNNQYTQLGKWMESLKKYRKSVEKSKDDLIDYRPKEDSLEERLRNLLTTEMNALIERMDGFLRDAPNPRDDKDIEDAIF